MKLIVISGPPATGKTNLARALSKKYKLPIVAKDSIKEALFDVLGVRNLQESNALGRASYRLLLVFLGVMLESKRDVIVEGNFFGSTGKSIAALAKKHQAKILQIACSASDEVIRKRVLRRWKSGKRHGGHRDGERSSKHARPQRQAERKWRIGTRVLQLNETKTERENTALALRFVQRFLDS